MCLFSRYGSAALASTLQGRLVSSYCWRTKLADEPGARPPSLWPLVDGLRVHVGGGITRWRRRRTVRPVAYRLKNGSYLLRASSPPTVTGWGCDTTLFLSSVDWLLWTDGSEVRVRSRGRRVHACPPPAPPSALVAGRMNLASCPGQGLCLSHARLDPRHFMALTSPPTVTAALNEAAHMCTDRVGSEPSVQLNTVWPILFKARRCFGAPAGSIVSASGFFLFHAGVRAFTVYQARTMACPL